MQNNQIRHNRTSQPPTETSWQNVADWYQKSVGSKGSHYHQQVILPQALKMLNLQGKEFVLDLACGQGVLARNLPRQTKYLGIDIAADLITEAEKQNRNPQHAFMVADITKPLMLNAKFDVCTIILALQNLENPLAAFANAAKYLKLGGKLLIVINHPHFRIPRQTAWGIDEQTKQQYRKVYRYMSELKIPIDMTPGQGSQKLTWSFHQPLQNYVQMLKQNNLAVLDLQEWVSDKTSVGKAAKMENLSREEIPMFMAILAVKH